MRIVTVGTPVRALLVQQAGVLSPAQRRDAVKEVLARARELGCYRILVDYRQAHVFEHDDASNERAADLIAEAFRGRDARLAAVVRFDHQLDDALETMLAARGVATRRFDDFAEAMDWVQSQQPVASSGATVRPRREEDPVAIAVRAVDPGLALLPSQFATVVHLVADLLAEGLDEDRIQPLARRMARSLKGVSTEPGSGAPDVPGARRDQPGPR